MTSRKTSSSQVQVIAVTIATIVTVATVVMSTGFTGIVAAAAGNGPAVGITSPAADAELDSQPVIRGEATDDGSVTKIEVSIQRSNGDYFNGNSWQSSETWLTASGTTDWTYDVYDNGNGITTDGTYTVTARATDDDGQTQSEPFDEVGANPTSVSYTVDSQAPTMTSVTVTDTGSDDTVAPGETVTVSADVQDATAGVDTVTADASQLGGPATLELTASSGSTYDASFTVSEPEVGDGDVSLSVTATDTFGHTTSSSDNIALDTAVDSVSQLSVDHDFVGIVEDDSKLRVTATDVADAQGNRVDDDTATVKIADQTYDVAVVDGEIDATIDPTEISNTASTGTTDVSLADSTTTVTLVHEVNGLTEGYQAAGTPMPATDVLVEDVNDVTAYDTANESWSQPAEQQAGEGYYIDAASDDARIGYVFDETVSKSSDSELLNKGYNLVGASPDMNTGDSVQVNSDLGSDIAPSDSAIEVRLPKDGTNPGDKKGLDAFKSPAADTDNTNAYEAYWVYVDSEGNYVRTTVEVAYDPSEQN